MHAAADLFAVSSRSIVPSPCGESKDRDVALHYSVGRSSPAGDPGGVATHTGAVNRRADAAVGPNYGAAPLTPPVSHNVEELVFRTLAEVKRTRAQLNAKWPLAGDVDRARAELPNQQLLMPRTPPPPKAPPPQLGVTAGGLSTRPELEPLQDRPGLYLSSALPTDLSRGSPRSTAVDTSDGRTWRSISNLGKGLPPLHASTPTLSRRIVTMHTHSNDGQTHG